MPQDHRPVRPVAGSATAGDSQHDKPRSKSMHADVAVWCDCCSCEMEPYWAEVAAELDTKSGCREE